MIYTWFSTRFWYWSRIVWKKRSIIVNMSPNATISPAVDVHRVIEYPIAIIVIARTISRIYRVPQNTGAFFHSIVRVFSSISLLVFRNDDFSVSTHPVRRMVCFSIIIRAKSRLDSSMSLCRFFWNGITVRCFPITRRPTITIYTKRNGSASAVIHPIYTIPNIRNTPCRMVSSKKFVINVPQFWTPDCTIVSRFPIPPWIEAASSIKKSRSVTSWNNPFMIVCRIIALVEYLAWTKRSDAEMIVITKTGMDAKIRVSSEDFARARFVIFDTVLAEIKTAANTNTRNRIWNHIGHCTYFIGVRTRLKNWIECWKDWYINMMYFW